MSKTLILDLPEAEKQSKEKRKLLCWTPCISSKKWADKGGTKGFGWKYFKTKKYLCVDAIEARKYLKKPILPSNTCIEAGILGERFGDYTSDVVGGRLEDITTTTLCSGEKVSADQ